MAQNFIFLLAEGDHDSAFIYRILKANDAQTDNRMIKKYPFPLNNLFSHGISNVSIAELNIQDAGSRFLPYRVMRRGSNNFILFTIGGDAQRDKRISLVKTINALNVEDKDAIQVLKDASISILYFFDADAQGVAARLQEMKTEFGEIFGQPIPDLANGCIYTLEDLKLGTYVFSEDGKDTGRLEDILIPLMKQGNTDIFDAANTFLGIHENTSLFSGKCQTDNGIIKKVNGQKYNHSKSLVGTVGQLQKSGKSNTVCISDADYLSNTKIRENGTCITIYSFIQSVMI